MEKPILSAATPVVFLGAGEFSPPILSEALTYASPLVAADGGAALALAAGIIPAAVVGDFDSLDAETRAALDPETLHHVAEQETTDFEKCLTRVDAPLALAVGFSGPRADHALAVMNALIKHPDRRCVVIGAEDIVFHAPARLRLSLAPGMRLSLFPMRRVEGVSKGLRWPIEGQDFAPWAKIGTSNEVTEGPVDLSFSGPGMLVILPRSALGHAVRALGG